jgi:predicted nucleotide-binding protein (sugar kinase/HSP70/actin superfamily)
VQIQISPGSSQVIELPKPVEFQPRKTKVPLRMGKQRLIIATCEKGTVEDLGEMKDIKSDIDKIKDLNPNYVEIAAHDVFRHKQAELVSDALPSTKGLFIAKAIKERIGLMERRKDYRIGIPRLLNTYTYAPLFNAYFASLGIKAENIVYSDYTTPELYRAGASRGAIDPCYPSKIGIAHVYNLLATKHSKKPLNAIWFPMYDVLHSHLVNLTGSNACPTVTATPETVKAAFMKESDIFSENGIIYIDPILNLQDQKQCADQMFQAWAPLLGLSREENERAVAAGFDALHECEAEIRRQARQTLDQLEREDRIGIVMLGRVYHHDPGLNHEIMEEFQKLGYPVFSQSTLPTDEDLLDRLFGEEVRAGMITHPLDISDVWKNRYSTSTNHKVWAAKFTARHPNLVALEVSSFKCGHDAPIYGVIEGIIEQSGTPYFFSRIWMKISPLAPSESASKQSTTSCAVTARTSSSAGRLKAILKRSSQRWNNRCEPRARANSRWQSQAIDAAAYLGAMLLNQPRRLSKSNLEVSRVQENPWWQRGALSISTYSPTSPTGPSALS